MPEPVALAITVACASVISGIVTLTQQITTFVSQVRSSRKDIDAVSRELSSLALCLEALRDDSSKISFPESLQQNLVGVLRNCDDVTKEMQDLLTKLSRESLRTGVQWSMLARDEMNKLRSRLEAHKSAIDIALEMISIFLITSVKEDTQAIRLHTTNIRQDTSQIASLVQQIGLLRLQVAQREDRGGSGDMILERFLAESTTYAESVVDTEDLDALDFSRNPTSTIPEEGDWSDLESSHLDEPPLGPRVQPRQSPGRASLPPTQQEPPLAPAQRPAPDLDAQPRSLPDILPVGPSISPLKVGSMTGGPGKKPKEQKPHLELDHKAIEVAEIAGSKLSESKRRELDNKLLLLLEGNQGKWRAVPGQRDFRRDKVGTCSKVRAVLDRGADPNAELQRHTSFGRGGCTALQVEVLNACRTEVVRLLLSRGADPNAKGPGHVSALPSAVESKFASKKQCLELIEVLVGYGADVNVQGGQHGNALRAAVVMGNLQAVKYLVEYGADVNAQDGEGRNALYTAAYMGNLEAVEYLVEQGADVNAQGGYYRNALQSAAYSRKFQVVMYLVEYGADVNAQGGYYGNALQAAAAREDLKTVEYLVEHGADVNARGGLYGNALQAAASEKWGKVQVVEYLVEHGADVNAQGGQFGNALQAAAARGNLQAVKYLVEHEADVNAQGGYYGNALQAALKSENPARRYATVKLLKEYGASED